MSKTHQKLIDQIRQAARESRMSQNALARVTGVDVASVNRFITGKRGLSMEGINSLADVLNLRIVATKPVKLPPPSKPGRKPSGKAK